MGLEEAVRAARDREILTPQRYEAAFKEGYRGFLLAGVNAKNPYLVVGEPSDLARAWDNGWWARAKDESR